MSDKKEREEKERAIRERTGVKFIYNAETQAFAKKVRDKYGIKHPFAYDYNEEADNKDVSDKLIEDVKKFIDTEWEPRNETERLFLDTKDPLSKAKSLKKELRKIGFLSSIIGVFMPKKLVKRVIESKNDPVEEIRNYRERSLLNYILTSEVDSFNPDVTEFVYRIQLSGEPFVVLLASNLASPDIAASKFRKFFLSEFGKKNRPPADPLKDSRFYERKMAGIPIKDIADEWIEENENKFPEIGSINYLEKKRKLEEYIEGRIKEFTKTLK